MSPLREAFAIVDLKAGELFAAECGLRCPVQFADDIIRVFVDGFTNAKRLYCGKYTVLGIRCWEWGQSGVEICWLNEKGLLKIFFVEPQASIKLRKIGKFKMASKIESPKIVVPSVFVNFSQLSRPLLDALIQMVENHNKVMGITRLADERQLFITPALAQAIKSDPEEATTRKMSDFWLASDLEALHPLLKQQGTTGFEHTYRAALDKNKQQWGQFTSKFRVIEDDLGIAYRFVEIVNLNLIENPILVN